jgi:3alpha(or 20beta)-hydroxysteroid dehydrogenase
LILVNNAGVYKRGGVDKMSLADIDLMYRTNQRAILLSVKTLYDELARNEGGCVINISSTAGITGDPLITAYSGTKWAVRGLTRSLAAELGPLGIRVNAIIPGLFDTAMADANGNEVNEAILARTSLARIGEPKEITPAVLLAASDEASYMTGAELVVDGGLSI